MPRRFQEEAQTIVDTKALEMAVANDAVTQQHLIECRDRYLEIRDTIRSLRGDIKGIFNLLWCAVGAAVLVVLGAMGYLLAHGGIPITH